MSASDTTPDNGSPAPRTGSTLSARRRRVRQLDGRATTGRRADTQHRLIEAGRRVIAQHGVEGASVGSITAEAGFTRGAFYSNFSDMDHFVALVAAHEWDTILSSVSEKLARALTTALGGDGSAGDEGGSGDTPEGGSVQVAAEVTASRDAPGTPPGPGPARADIGPTASHIATSLTESTRPLLDSVSERVRGLSGEERLSVLARAMLVAVPRDRDSHLLWAALANFTVREPDASPALRESFREFRAGMASYLMEVLAALRMEPTVDPLDAVDLVVAVGTRSMRARLVNPGPGRDDLIDRVLPHLLPALTRPLP